MTTHVITERAVNAWGKCGLTLSQRHTELLNLAHRLEDERLKLFLALSDIVRNGTWTRSGDRLCISRQTADDVNSLLWKLENHETS